MKDGEFWASMPIDTLFVETHHILVNAGYKLVQNDTWMSARTQLITQVIRGWRIDELLSIGWRTINSNSYSLFHPNGSHLVCICAGTYTFWVPSSVLEKKPSEILNP